MLCGGGRQGHQAGPGTTCGEVEESMGILSGLKSLGLGNLEDVSLFEEPKKKEAEKQEQVAAPKVQEKDLIYDRRAEREFQRDTRPHPLVGCPVRYL